MDLRGVVERVRRRARRLSGAAKEATSPGTAGPRFTFLFVVTYGRSGSTLIQGLLNSLPKTLIRGENDLYVLTMYRAWAQVREFKQLHGRDAHRGPQSAFYGLNEMRPREFVTSTRQLVVRQLLGNTPKSKVRVLGFKEVLWHRIEPQETEGFFEFLEAMFPQARYVVNRRDHEQAATSGFWQQRGRDAAAAAMTRVEQIQDYLLETRPERTLATQFERFTSKDPAVVEEELRSLAQHAVGRCDDRILSAMQSTITQPHGPRPFGRSRRTRPDKQVPELT